MHSLQRGKRAPLERITLADARRALRALADPRKAQSNRRFFKKTTNVFLGVTTPQIRPLARQYRQLTLGALRDLMKSHMHEEQSLAHAILVQKFRAGDARTQAQIFHFYLRHRKFIRTWDGVDDSAPYIVGPYLLHRGKRILHELARSHRIWDRRIAIVATWWFIRQGEAKTTIQIARALLDDSEDLIHKATGWMLREVGKRDLPALRRFLRAYSHRMPRTALRYSIERFSQEEKKFWLSRKQSRVKRILGK